MSRSFYRIMTVLVLIIILFFSRQPSGSQNISPFLEQNQRLMELVEEAPQIIFEYNGRLIDSHAAPAAFLQFVFRKMVHFCLYGLFGLLLLLSLDDKGKFTLRSWLLAFILVLGLATLDEFIQSNVVSRTGCLPDVLVDMSGFLAASAVKFGVKQG